MKSILNSYEISLAFALGSSIGNFLLAACGAFDYNRAIGQSIIVTILFLVVTTVGKLAIHFSK